EQKALMALNRLDYTFVPTRFHSHPLPLPQFIYSYNLNKTLKKNQLPKKFYKWLDERKYTHRQILIFVPTISLAERLLPQLADQLIHYSVIKDESFITSVHAK